MENPVTKLINGQPSEEYGYDGRCLSCEETQADCECSDEEIMAATKEVE